MKYLLLSVILLHFVNLLCAVTVHPKENVTIFDLNKPITMTCRVTTTPDEKVTVTWYKNETKISDLQSISDRATITNSEGNYTLQLSKGVEQDYANYTCSVSIGNNVVGNATILAVARIILRTPDNVNVVEGEKLRIQCTVFGRPAPKLSWEIGNKTYEHSEGIVKLLPDKDKNITNAVLTIENLNMTDRGIYRCIGRSDYYDLETTHETMVRIKDKYAALWPFLGICLEVFVLCAVILIYEKKRNKTELEESDTDQSPDQKNTPDHGKESNLRHRQ